MVGRAMDGRLLAAYRVSSRSFPNRDAVKLGHSVQIVPRSQSPDAVSDSPYIAYECIVWNERFAVVSNGSHTRPIFERLKAGDTPRDAMLHVLAGLDREFDQHDTPRICGLFDVETDTTWLGSVTATALAIMPVVVQPGRLHYIATYGFPLPSSEQSDELPGAIEAPALCRHVIESPLFATFENPICAAAAIAGDAIAVTTLNV